MAAVESMSSPDAASRVRLDNLRITFPRNDGSVLEVVSGISMSVGVGEFVAVVGPSGSGKSTILRAISGLLKPAGGMAYVNETAVSGPPPHVGFMFQKDALLPWLTVAENITVGCELAGTPSASRKDRVASLISLLGLAGFENTYPNRLSGGMRQRASLGRILAYEPALMLMDEPFGALDYQTKITMGRELLRIWEAERRSILFVTHDIEEAVTLADRVIVFSHRPARIVADYTVNLPRPRNLRALRSDPDFARLTEAIWSDLALPS